MAKKELRYYYNKNTRQTAEISHSIDYEKYESNSSWVRVVGRKDNSPFKIVKAIKKRKKKKVKKND